MRIEDCIPCDDIPGDCECEIVEDEETWHYPRRCASCKAFVWSLHCPHDRIQSACAACGQRLKVKE